MLIEKTTGQLPAPKLPAGSSTLPLAELGKLPAGVYVLTPEQAGSLVRLKLVRE